MDKAGGLFVEVLPAPPGAIKKVCEKEVCYGYRESEMVQQYQGLRIYRR